jgi:hypothetical protein
MFYVLFMCKCVLPPGVNPIGVDKYIDINIKFEFRFRFLTDNYTRINDRPVETRGEVIHIFVGGTRNSVCTLIYKVVSGVVPDSLTCTVYIHIYIYIYI